MKQFLSITNFKILVSVLSHSINKPVSYDEQNMLYHIMIIIENKGQEQLINKNKLALKLVSEMIKNKANITSSLYDLPINKDILKSVFIPLTEQRNILDIFIKENQDNFKDLLKANLEMHEDINLKYPEKHQLNELIIDRPEELQKMFDEMFTNYEKTHYLLIDSRDRNNILNPNTYDYEIKITNPYKSIKSIQLLSAEIPKTEYLINTFTNSIHFEETNGTILVAILDSKNYTISELISAIQTKMNNIGSSTYTVLTNSDNIITITSDLTGGSGIFNLLFFGGTENYDLTTRKIYKENSIGSIIGFERVNLSGQSSYSGIRPITIVSDPIIYLYITNPSINTMNGSNESYIKLSMDNEFGTTFFYKIHDESYNNYYLNPYLERLSTLRIQFKHHSGNFYDFNGMNNSLLFEIKTLHQDLKYTFE